MPSRAAKRSASILGEVIAVDPFDLVGVLKGYAQIEVNHQLRQTCAVCSGSPVLPQSSPLDIAVPFYSRSFPVMTYSKRSHSLARTST